MRRRCYPFCCDRFNCYFLRRHARSPEAHAIPKRSDEMRDRPSRRQAWHSDSMVSPDEVGFDLRERLPLPHNILSKTDLAGQSWCGAACGYMYHRGCGQCIHNPKDETYYLDYHVSARDSAESGMGNIGN